MPFGMLSPDTQVAPDWDKASGYDYNDTHLCGFSHTRLSGTGASDLIDLLLVPVSEASNLSDPVWYQLRHDQEEARPGYYSIMLDGIKAELTATTRTGIHRYTYPSGQPQSLLIDLDHSAQKGSWQRRIIQSQLRVVSQNVIEGYRIITGWAKLRRVYFHIELSCPVTSCQLRESLGSKVFKTKIRKNVSLAEAPYEVKDIVTYAPKSNGAADYMEFVSELVEKVK